MICLTCCHQTQDGPMILWGSCLKKNILLDILLLRYRGNSNTLLFSHLVLINMAYMRSVPYYSIEPLTSDNYTFMHICFVCCSEVI